MYRIYVTLSFVDRSREEGRGEGARGKYLHWGFNARCNRYKFEKTCHGNGARGKIEAVKGNATRLPRETFRRASGVISVFASRKRSAVHVIVIQDPELNRIAGNNRTFTAYLRYVAHFENISRRYVEVYTHARTHTRTCAHICKGIMRNVDPGSFREAFSTASRVLRNRHAARHAWVKWEEP